MINQCPLSNSACINNNDNIINKSDNSSFTNERGDSSSHYAKFVRDQPNSERLGKTILHDVKMNFDDSYIETSFDERMKESIIIRSKEEYQAYEKLWNEKMKAQELLKKSKLGK